MYCDHAVNLSLLDFDRVLTLQVLSAYEQMCKVMMLLFFLVKYPTINEFYVFVFLIFSFISVWWIIAWYHSVLASWIKRNNDCIHFKHFRMLLTHNMSSSDKFFRMQSINSGCYCAEIPHSIVVWWSEKILLFLIRWIIQ